MLTSQDLIAFTQDHTYHHTDFTRLGGALNLYTQEPDVLLAILQGIDVLCSHKVCDIRGDYIQIVMPS